MALTINTNLGSLIVKKDLQTATNNLHKALKQAKLSESIKDIATINQQSPVADDKVDTQLNAISVAQDNVAIGSGMLSTADSNFDVISTQFNRIKTFVKEMESGKISDSVGRAKIQEAFEAIDIIAKGTEFNGTKLLDGNDEEVKLQIGTDKSNDSKISIGSEIFLDSKSEALVGMSKDDFISLLSDKENGYSKIYEALNSASATISARRTNIAKVQNKLDATADSLDVQYANITSSMSTIKDADVASSSAENIKSQILSQASASLVSVANQSPSTAINLI